MRIAMIDPGGFSLPYDMSLCQALASAGNAVRLMTCPDRHGDSEWPSGVQVDYHYYRLSQNVRKSRQAARYWARYIKAVEHVFDMERLVGRLRQWGPDVIHLQWLVLPLVDRLFVPRLQRIAPTILTVHDTEAFNGEPSSFLQTLRVEETMVVFNAIIVHTEYSKKQLVQRTGLESKRVAIIDHGVLGYYAHETPESTTLEQDQDVHHVLLFGSLKYYKGVDVLLEAVAMLPSHVVSEMVVDIVGSPAMDVRPLQRRAVELGIGERIRWDLRRVPEYEVKTLFRKASVVVLPYRRIDQSGVLMTALAFGKPIIASKIGGFPEIIKDGVHGCLVPPEDAQSLSRALARLLGDPEMRRRMGSACISLAKNRFSWRTIARETLGLYESTRERAYG